MRIVDAVATPVRVPRLERFLPKTAHGEMGASEYVILELVSDEGITGLGEVTCSPKWNGEEARSSVELIDNQLRELLVGTPLLSSGPVFDSVLRLSRDKPFLCAAIEMALMDLIGKSYGISVAELLGGARRHSIPTKIVLPARGIEIVGPMASDAKALGAESLKVKVGLDVESDVARVQAVRDKVGNDIPLTVDANEGWTLAEAQRALAQLADVGVAAVEQPLSRDASDENARLRTAGIPLVGDESIWNLHDIIDAKHVSQFDIVSLYPGKCGGISECLRLAKTAEDLGLGISYGSNLELGIGAAALAHAAAVGPPTHPSMPADLIGPLYFESSLVTDATFVKWSGATVPSGPGLGVELDRNAMARYSVALEIPRNA